MSEYYTVGPLLDASSDKDITFKDEHQAFEAMEKMAEESEDLLVGLYVGDDEHAKYVAINGEKFSAL